MKSLFFLLFYLVITNASPVASPIESPVESPGDNGCLPGYYDMYILNVVNNPIVVHIQSKDDDLGNRSVPVNGNTHWGFCLNFFHTTRFYAHFYSNSRSAFFDVFQYDIVTNVCGKAKAYKEKECFWLVRDNGFYISPQRNGGWTKLHDWA